MRKTRAGAQTAALLAAGVFLPLLLVLVGATLWVLSVDLQLSRDTIDTSERAYIESQVESLGPDLNIENGQIERPIKPVIRAAVATPGDVAGTHGIAMASVNGNSGYFHGTPDAWSLGAAILLCVFLVGAAVVTIRAFERNRRAAAETARLLAEKETILKEVHHRIRNDMAIVSSLLSLHAERIESEEGEIALREAHDRVHLMSKIYDSLYRSEDVQYVHLSDTLAKLVGQLADGYGRGEVDLRLALDERLVPRRIAVPLSICIAEVVTNSFKYAGGESDGIALELTLRVQDQHVQYVQRDSGPGFPAAIVDGDSGGFGHMVVDALVGQLGGTVERTNDNGAVTTISIPR